MGPKVDSADTMAAVRAHVGAAEGEPLPSFAWPGGYQIVYYTAGGLTICPECANDTDTSDPVTSGDVYWEGPDEYCEDCGTAIPSAYGDPNDNDRPGPGQFQACASLKLAEYLHGLSLDSSLADALGEVDGFGWYGLVIYDGSDEAEAAGATDCYVLNEDSQGFFTYETFDSGTDSDPRIASMDARAEWSRIEREYVKFSGVDTAD